MRLIAKSYSYSFLRGNYELEQKSEGFNLGAMLTVRNARLRKCLENFSIRRHYAPRGTEFFASDDPVYTIGPDDEGDMVVGTGFDALMSGLFSAEQTRLFLHVSGNSTAGSLPDTKDRRAGELLDDVDCYQNISTASKRSPQNNAAFDQNGCKVKAGENAFMTKPRPPGWRQP